MTLEFSSILHSHVPPHIYKHTNMSYTQMHPTSHIHITCFLHTHIYITHTCNHIPHLPCTYIIHIMYSTNIHIHHTYHKHIHTCHILYIIHTHIETYHMNILPIHTHYTHHKHKHTGIKQTHTPQHNTDTYKHITYILYMQMYHIHILHYIYIYIHNTSYISHTPHTNT